MTARELRTALGLGIGILTFAGAIASAVHTVEKRLADIDTRMQKLESAVKTLNADQSDERYKQLVKDLLAEMGQPVGAVREQHVHQFGAVGALAGSSADTSASAPAAKPPKPN